MQRCDVARGLCHCFVYSNTWLYAYYVMSNNNTLMNLLTLRTRKHQASKDSTMWPTPSSRDLVWRPSFRSVTLCWSVCMSRRWKSCRKEERLVDYCVYLLIYCIFLWLFILSTSTGPHWLCELFGVEWARRVSLQILKFYLQYFMICDLWLGIATW